MDKELKTWEKVLARALDYHIGRNDEDEPKVPVLSMRHSRKGLWMRLVLQLVNWLTCFVIIAGVIRHW
jgi:hypothetical protein